MPDLTGLPVLDVIIGMVFLFVLLSALCSGIQEVIASFFKLRARMLENALRNFLNDPAAGEAKATDFAEKIYNHPLVRPLWRDGKPRLRKKDKQKRLKGKTTKTRKPSYIPPRTFALALFDVVAPGLETTDKDGAPRRRSDILDDLIAKLEPPKAPGDGRAKAGDREKAAPSIPDELRQALLTLAKQARGDIDAFRKGVEDWFDDAMARVSGWYKRQAWWILALVIAPAVTFGLNVDSALIAQTLWKDQAVRTAVVGQATKAAQKTQPGGKELEKTADSVNSVKKLGIPLGWPHDKKPKADQKQRKDPRAFTLRKIPGWAFTWLALLLGAPFWFDLLKRLVQLRGTGPPETTGASKPSANSRHGRSHARA
jgi:hypothetical protein